MITPVSDVSPHWRAGASLRSCSLTAAGSCRAPFQPGPDLPPLGPRWQSNAGQSREESSAQKHKFGIQAADLRLLTDAKYHVQCLLGGEVLSVRFSIVLLLQKKRTDLSTFHENASGDVGAYSCQIHPVSPENKRRL